MMLLDRIQLFNIECQITAPPSDIGKHANARGMTVEKCRMRCWMGTNSFGTFVGIRKNPLAKQELASKKQEPTELALLPALTHAAANHDGMVLMVAPTRELAVLIGRAAMARLNGRDTHVVDIG